MRKNFLTELGYDADRICLFDFSDSAHFKGYESTLITPIEAALTGTKREKLFTVLETLNQSKSCTTNTFSCNVRMLLMVLVTCETDDCTLCMSCVSVCPTRALHAIGDRPGLLFVEQDCIQCGMCEKACPEKVITRLKLALIGIGKHVKPISLFMKNPQPVVLVVESLLPLHLW